MLRICPGKENLPHLKKNEAGKKKCSWTEQLIIKWLFFFLCEVEKSISLYDRQLPGSEKEPGGKTQPLLVSTRLKLRLNYYWRHREPWENMLQKSLDLIPITRADQGTTTQNSLFPPSSYTHTPPSLPKKWKTEFLLANHTGPPRGPTAPETSERRSPPPEWSWRHS